MWNLNNQEVAKRLTTIREERAMNPRQFAMHAGIDISQYSKIEKGKLPITEKIMSKLVKAYSLDQEYILYGTLIPHGTGIHNQAILSDSGASYLDQRRAHKNKSMPVLVPFVPVKAQAGYARSFDNSEFINSLEMYPILPGVDPRGAVWRFFEIQGDSMEPELFENDYILVSMVPYEYWGDIKSGQVHVIVTEDSVLVKKVNPIDTDKWMLTSSNKRHKPKAINVNEIKELWKFRTFASKVLNRGK